MNKNEKKRIRMNKNEKREEMKEGIEWKSLFYSSIDATVLKPSGQSIVYLYIPHRRGEEKKNYKKKKRNNNNIFE